MLKKQYLLFFIPILLLLVACDNSGTVDKFQSGTDPSNIVIVEHQGNKIKNITIDVNIPNSILSTTNEEKPEFVMESIDSDYNSIEGVKASTKYNSNSVNQTITIDTSKINKSSQYKNLLKSIDFNDFEQFKQKLTSDDRFLEIE